MCCLCDRLLLKRELLHASAASFVTRRNEQLLHTVNVVSKILENRNLFLSYLQHTANWCCCVLIKTNTALQCMHSGNIFIPKLHGVWKSLYCVFWNILSTCCVKENTSFQQEFLAHSLVWSSTDGFIFLAGSFYLLCSEMSDLENDEFSHCVMPTMPLHSQP